MHLKAQNFKVCHIDASKNSFCCTKFRYLVFIHNKHDELLNIYVKHVKKM